ncbi:DUF6924 domain-containing protein [Streptosporangium canum]
MRRCRRSPDVTVESSIESDFCRSVISEGLRVIHANLFIGNMDFGEFAESADADGVFRGFHS